MRKEPPVPAPFQPGTTICAALAWYDEPVEFLDRCVRSLGEVCDEIVAIDGAWKHFDGGNASPADQEETIWRAARDSGLACRVHVPFGQDVWESQVEKRAELMRMASEHADWVFVIDGDEYVSRCDHKAVRKALANTRHVVAAVELTNLHQGETMPGVTRLSGLKQRIYRAGTSVAVVHSGYVYGKAMVHSQDYVDLREHLHMEHDNVNRGSERNERARAYRRARETQGVEKWAPPRVTA